MRLSGIPELLDERMLLQRVLHDPALHAFAPPVNQPHFTQAALVRSTDVLVDD
jgi:hypothetical protein